MDISLIQNDKIHYPNLIYLFKNSLLRDVLTTSKINDVANLLQLIEYDLQSLSFKFGEGDITKERYDKIISDLIEIKNIILEYAGKGE